LECTEKPECRQVLIDATRPGEMRFFFQELGQEPLAEKIIDELGIEIRHVMKLVLAIEKALTHDPMNVKIPLQKVSRGVDGKASPSTSWPRRSGGVTVAGNDFDNSTSIR